MAEKGKKHRTTENRFLAFVEKSKGKDMLITEEYRKQQQDMHAKYDYGTASVAYAPLVTSVINNLGITKMLDYGAGRGRLGESIEPDHAVTIDHYDPAIPDWAEEPEPCELVCCIDVLEHIEPDLIDNVLDDLKRVTQRYGFFSIHTGPAVKILQDGRNAHLIQEDFRWWLPRLWERFNIYSMTHAQGGFYVVVTPNGPI